MAGPNLKEVALENKDFPSTIGGTDGDILSFYDLAVGLGYKAANSPQMPRQYRIMFMQAAYEVLKLNDTPPNIRKKFKKLMISMLGKSGNNKVQIDNSEEGKLIQSTIYHLDPLRDSLDKIVGLKQAKEALKRSISYPVRYGSVLRAQNLSPPQGVLLYGPPGTGKTILVRAVCASDNVTLFCPTTAQVMSGTIGGSDKIVRAIFTTAMANQPSVVFMDEFDAIANPAIKGNPVLPGIRAQFLTNMTDTTFMESDCAFVAASNYPKNIDDAILSRLGSQVYVGIPSESDDGNEVYRSIFEIQLGRRAPDLNQAAQRAVQKNFSPRDIKEICTVMKNKVLSDWEREDTVFVKIKETAASTEYAWCKDEPSIKAEYKAEMKFTSYVEDPTKVSGPELLTRSLDEVARIYLPKVSEDDLLAQIDLKPATTQAKLDSFKLGTESFNSTSGVGGGTTAQAPRFNSIGSLSSAGLDPLQIASQ